MPYRIVDTDNFGEDYPNEQFVGEEYDNEIAAQLEADKLNGPEEQTYYASRYYKVVAMPYKLIPGFKW